MELKKAKWIGIGIGFLVVACSFIWYGTGAFFIMIGVGIIIGVSPYIALTVIEGKVNAEKEQMFIEFARDLVESVKSGTPISKSIVNVQERPYGVLSKHVRKLSNQILMGIPLGIALKTFARDVNNKTVSRALTLIGEAEKAGGNIGEILEAVAGAVNMSDKLKKERQAVISGLVVQGYIIFFIFIIIMLVMQFKILPIASGLSEGLGGVESASLGGLDSIMGGEVASTEELARPFFWLLITQGLFAGLVIGKLSEGKVKSGLKHSFILIVFVLLINTGVKVFLG